MSESKEETITEAIALLAGQAQRTLRQELEKAQSSANPPFFLKLELQDADKENDEDFKRDLVELQNFADVLAETMVQLLKQAEQTLLEKMKKIEAGKSDQRKTDKFIEQKRREDEVRNFTKIFAETRASLVEQVKDIIKELRKGQGDDDSSPKRPESIFSIIGIDDTRPSTKPKKRPYPSTSGYEFPKKPRISPPTNPSKKKTVVEEGDVCHICNEVGHWAYQCSKPDDRMCYICNKKGHIAKKCSMPENRSCYKCLGDGHIAADCRVKTRDSNRNRKLKSYSSQDSSSSCSDSV